MSPCSLAEIEGFIRDMRELGAARVRVGEVAVDFDLPLVHVGAAGAKSDEEERLERERLMYGSSD